MFLPGQNLYTRLDAEVAGRIMRTRNSSIYQDLPPLSPPQRKHFAVGAIFCFSFGRGFRLYTLRDEYVWKSNLTISGTSIWKIHAPSRVEGERKEETNENRKNQLLVSIRHPGKIIIIIIIIIKKGSKDVWGWWTSTSLLGALYIY